MGLLYSCALFTIKGGYQHEGTGVLQGLSRARKGFNVRLNIDAHWSCAFYKYLDYIQLKDGEDKVILNRDDAAGFRLDTTYTHKQHKILAEASNPELTTRTDYVNKYASVLQTTSYLFMGTENTAET